MISDDGNDELLRPMIISLLPLWQEHQGQQLCTEVPSTLCALSQLVQESTLRKHPAKIKHSS